MDDAQRFWWTLGGIAAALVVGVAAGKSAAEAQPVPAARPTVTATATVTVTSTPTPATAEQAAPTIGDGTWLVGTDLQAGTWRAANEDGRYCVWRRLSDTSGSYDAVIAGDGTDGPAVVTIADTDAAFKSSGCGVWERQA